MRLRKPPELRIRNQLRVDRKISNHHPMPRDLILKKLRRINPNAPTLAAYAGTYTFSSTSSRDVQLPREFGEIRALAWVPN
jgi:hypothetical protein